MNQRERMAAAKPRSNAHKLEDLQGNIRGRRINSMTNRLGKEQTWEKFVITHTKLDRIIVDPANDRPIGMPLVTIVLDTFSGRGGFHVGFIPMNNARCIPEVAPSYADSLITAYNRLYQEENLWPASDMA